MALTIKSYYKTNPINEEQLQSALESAKDQENKIYQLFKQFGTMTNWDVYDVYNELIGPIYQTSVGRSINTLKKQNIIYSLGTVTGDAGRPVNLYKLSENNPETIQRKLNTQIPNSIKLDIQYNTMGEIDVEKMIEEFDTKLNKLAEQFNLTIN